MVGCCTHGFIIFVAPAFTHSYLLLHLSSQVIKFLGDEQDQITFVTRAVRVVDLITNLDMAAFQSHSGLTIFIYRLEVAVLYSCVKCYSLPTLHVGLTSEPLFIFIAEFTITDTSDSVNSTQVVLKLFLHVCVLA